MKQLSKVFIAKNFKAPTKSLLVTLSKTTHLSSTTNNNLLPLPHHHVVQQHYYSTTTTTGGGSGSIESNHNDQIVGHEIYLVNCVEQEDSCYWSLKNVCSSHSTKKKALVACLRQWDYGRYFTSYYSPFASKLKTLPKYLQFEILDYLTLQYKNDLAQYTPDDGDCITVDDAQNEDRIELIVNELKELTATTTTTDQRRPQLEEMSEIEVEEIVEYLSSLEEGIGNYGMVYRVEKMTVN